MKRSLAWVLCAIAVACFAVAWATHVIFDAWTDPWGWVYAGLALFAGSFLAPSG